MANVLGELFGEIAESIRGKTGDTGTMKPAQFPEKIRAIKTPSSILPLSIAENGTYTAPSGVAGYNPVTVDVKPVLQDKTITENGEYTADAGFDGLGKVLVEVAGSGGGSLPAGLYWEFGEFAPPNHYYQKWVVFNGVLYAFTRTNANAGNECNVYKLSDGKWTQIISSKEVLAFGAVTGWNYVEFNGKIHMIGNEQKYHYVFDGTNITTKNNVSNQISNDAVFVQDGKLKAYSYYDGNVYVWNETSDTWAVEATIGSKYQYYYFCAVDNTVYAIYSNWLYKYENGAKTSICACSVNRGIVSYNSFLYVYGNNYNNNLNTFRSDWYKFDPSENQIKAIGYGAYPDSNYSCFVKDGKLYFLFGNPSAKTNVASMHEVTE